MLTEKEKQEMLKDIDEIYAKKRYLNENLDDGKIITVGNLIVRQVNCSMEEYIEAHGLVEVKDIQWNK